jgi:hypothetical protein
MQLTRGTVGEGEKGMGRKGGQYTANLGSEWKRDSRHDTEEGFQVSKRGVSRNKGRDFQAKGDYQKDWGMHLHIYRAIVYVSC